MLNLPPATAYGKRIPKAKFYENLAVSPELKRIFTEQIAQITGAVDKVRFYSGWKINCSWYDLSREKPQPKITKQTLSNCGF